MLRIALLQLVVGPDPKQNLERALERAEGAAERGAELICLPELFTTRYFCQAEDASYFDLAERVDGPVLGRVRALARKHDVYVLAPFFERRARGLHHNSAL